MRTELAVHSEQSPGEQTLMGCSVPPYHGGPAASCRLIYADVLLPRRSRREPVAAATRTTPEAFPRTGRVLIDGAHFLLTVQIISAVELNCALMTFFCNAGAVAKCSDVQTANLARPAPLFFLPFFPPRFVLPHVHVGC